MRRTPGGASTWTCRVSERPRARGTGELADWLDGAAERPVGDSTPLTVVGSSLGGLLARDLAARRPRQCLGIALPAQPPTRPRWRGSRSGTSCRCRRTTGSQGTTGHDAGGTVASAAAGAQRNPGGGTVGFRFDVQGGTMTVSAHLPIGAGDIVVRRLRHEDAEAFALGTEDPAVREYGHLPLSEYTPEIVRDQIDGVIAE